MLNRRHFGVALVFGVLTPFPAFAGNIKPFSQAEFAAAQKAGKSILIDISASWCPTCKAQAPIIHSLIGSAKFKNMVTFQVDFDGQVDVVQAFGAQQQSTLIAFKGETETARSVGDTAAASIEALLASAI
jgi:thioredoxin-like negative regulator of GroEL